VKSKGERKKTTSGTHVFKRKTTTLRDERGRGFPALQRERSAERTTCQGKRHRDVVSRKGPEEPKFPTAGSHGR